MPMDTKTFASSPEQVELPSPYPLAICLGFLAGLFCLQFGQTIALYVAGITIIAVVALGEWLRFFVSTWPKEKQDLLVVELADFSRNGEAEIGSIELEMLTIDTDLPVVDPVVNVVEIRDLLVGLEIRSQHIQKAVDGLRKEVSQLQTQHPKGTLAEPVGPNKVGVGVGWSIIKKRTPQTYGKKSGKYTRRQTIKYAPQLLKGATIEFKGGSIEIKNPLSYSESPSVPTQPPKE